MLEFGEIRVDLARRQIWSGSEELHLSPKALDLLAHLIANRPRAVSKQELHEALWQGTFVSDASLPALVAELRRTLHDSPRKPRFVRTLHRFGYAFGAEVTESGEGMALDRGRLGMLVWDQGRLYLAAGEKILGREVFGAVTADTATISRRHARLVVSDAGAVLEDLGSKNGTCLRGARINRPVHLADGDRVVLGSFALTFRWLAGDQTTQTRGA